MLLNMLTPNNHTMKYSLILSLLIFIGTSYNTQASGTGIDFETDSWEDVLRRSDEEEKLIFLDAFASWCGPCKNMSKNVFTDPKVGEFYNENFINAKIDMEKGEGIELAKIYNVKAYPTLLFLNSKGEVVSRICGAMGVDDFIKTGESALKTATPLHKWHADFNAGKLNAEEMAVYLNLLYTGCAPTDEVANNYLSSLKDIDKVSKENFAIMSKYLADIDAEPFKFMMKDQASFKKFTDPTEVDRTIIDAYVSYGNKKYIRVKEFDAAAYKKYTERVKQETGSLADRITLTLEVLRLDRNKEWDEMLKKAMVLTKRYGLTDDPSLLNRMADRAYEHSNEPVVLTAAVMWAQSNFETTQNPIYHFTYAQLLNKTGQKEKALKVMEGATDLAKKDGYDLAPFIEYIEVIKQ